MNGLDQKAINTIRCLGADMPSAGNSGHPGAPIGCAPMAHTLWSRHMNYNPKNPKWWNRDRFVLSNGHACALLYAMLHLSGYDLSLDDLKNFRKIGSKTPGHPEVNHGTAGIEVTTGPLGQGVANAVGMAIAEKHLAAVYNKPNFDIIDNYVYVIVGDGCHQEGVSSEACSLAGHLQLGNLIVLYDDNNITIDGETSLSFTEDVKMRFESYGWDCSLVTQGDTNADAINEAVEKAKTIKDKPSMIFVRTTIGFGSKMENTHAVHGAPLKPDDLGQLKEKFGLKADESFYIPSDVKEMYAKLAEDGRTKENKWNELFASYKQQYPALASELERRFSGKLPEGWKGRLPRWSPQDKAIATRVTSGTVLNCLAEIMPEIMGGSADLTPSNMTALKCTHDFQAKTPDGRYLRFGVREHGMAAICNGLAAYGAFLPFGATFFNFIGYAMGAVRLSALSKLQVLYIMTHDSIGLGEDGPTHQPINSLAMLRSMPNILSVRPADGNETSGAYAVALENQTRPTVLVLSRAGLPQLAGSSLEGVSKGAYIIQQASNNDTAKLIIVASGSEVCIAIEAANILQKQGHPTRVVSMPCTTLFDEQSIDYKKSIFTEGVPVLSVEAMSTKGWSEYSHVQHGMTTFGLSGKGSDLMNHFGFTGEQVAAKGVKILQFYHGKHVHSLFDKPQF